MTRTGIFGLCLAGFLAVSLLMSCSRDGTGQGSSVKPIPSATTPTTTGLIYSYGDGADNRYELNGSSLTLTFNAVQPSESSSGTYSGGPNWSKVIRRDQYEAVMAIFTQAIAATDEQTWDRSKGTGIVEVDTGLQAILKMSSPIRMKLEAELQELGTSR